jgi:serine/threonine-protein kinase
MGQSLEPGAIVAGRYRLDRLLGQGGMGVVWAATHMITRRTVAMKFLKGPAHARPEMRQRFLREARAATAVKHPSVVEVHDVFELDDETPVMVMDFLSGETLAQRIDTLGKLSLEETATILLPVVSAVGTAHSRGVVHRDLKPENIFLAVNDEGRTEIKVLDFGIAKLSNADGEPLSQSHPLTGTGSILGTPFYSSPEQLFGERHIDHRADVWALGVVLYECLSGRLPVYGENLGQVMKALTSQDIEPLAKVAPFVPADVTRLVDRMLTRAMDQRPNDMREVLDVLKRYANVKVREFGEARSQPPPHEPRQTPGGPSVAPSAPEPPRKTPVHPQETATMLDSGGRAPKPPIDTASPHAVSRADAPRSRKIVVTVAFALGALAVGGLGWQLGRSRDPGGVTPAAPRDPIQVTAAPSIEPLPQPTAPVAAATAPPAPPETPAPATSADKSKAPASVKLPAAKSASNKADAGGKLVDSDASKNQKRAGGLIEDVPF